MDRLDVMVLRTMRQWMGQGSGVVLATVIRTWGSSPRPVGAMMAFNSEGHVVGSVSGGCIEADVARHGREAIASGAPRLREAAARRWRYSRASRSWSRRPARTRASTSASSAGVSSKSSPAGSSRGK